ncbi:MAG: acrR 1 [Acidimicrobiales bacterium]|nr:acrR 1 [Acidimicrobiales bacterium]
MTFGSTNLAAVPALVKRPYDTARRRDRSDETRTRILQVAREEIASHGYRATTIAKIARAAEVHIDTIYALIGRKPELLRELIERAISGSDRPLAPNDRSYVQAMRAEPDPVGKLSIYAGAVCAIQDRMGPLVIALRDAASTDAESHRVWREISDRRARNMRDLVRELGPDSTRRSGLTVDDAADVLWATASAEMFILLTRERGWTNERYEQWLADTWTRLLLPPSVG